MYLFLLTRTENLRDLAMPDLLMRKQPRMLSDNSMEQD